MNNPWNLTPREGETLSAVADNGCRKRAANAMDLALSTVDKHLDSARKKMDVHHMLQAVVRWDRYVNGRQS